MALSPRTNSTSQSPAHSPEQRDLLERMAVLCGSDSAENTLTKAQTLADTGNDEAAHLIAQWKLWQRYEDLLVRGRHDAIQAVSMMLYAAQDSALTGGSA